MKPPNGSRAALFARGGERSGDGPIPLVRGVEVERQCPVRRLGQVLGPVQRDHVVLVPVGEAVRRIGDLRVRRRVCGSGRCDRSAVRATRLPVPKVYCSLLCRPVGRAGRKGQPAALAVEAVVVPDAADVLAGLESSQVPGRRPANLLDAGTLGRVHVVSEVRLLATSNTATVVSMPTGRKIVPFWRVEAAEVRLGTFDIAARGEASGCR